MSSRIPRPYLRQAGMSLLVTLVALMSLMLAAIALVRSVDTGTLALGNLGFKQAATFATDRGSQAAITWLLTNSSGSSLYNDNVAAGYYASSNMGLDATGQKDPTWTATATKPARVLVEWENDGNASKCAGQSNFTRCVTPSATTTIGGFSISYVIFRNCAAPGDPNIGNECGASPFASSTSNSDARGEVKYGQDKRFSAPTGPFYQIVVRAAGARNTASFTETVVYF